MTLRFNTVWIHQQAADALYRWFSTQENSIASYPLTVPTGSNYKLRHSDPEIQQLEFPHIQDRLVIPRKSAMIRSLLTEYQKTPIGGHSAIHKTWFWRGMKSDITRTTTLQPVCLLQPPWRDFIGLPRSKRCDTVLVVVDRLSKYSHFIGAQASLHSPDGHTEVVNKSLQTYVRCSINGKPGTWAEWLPWVEYCYNTLLMPLPSAPPS